MDQHSTNEAPKDPSRQRLGFMAGEFQVRDDFDRMGEAEILEMFGLNDPEQVGKPAGPDTPSSNGSKPE